MDNLDRDFHIGDDFFFNLPDDFNRFLHLYYHLLFNLSDNFDLPYYFSDLDTSWLDY